LVVDGELLMSVDATRGLEEEFVPFRALHESERAVGSAGVVSEARSASVFVGGDEVFNSVSSEERDRVAVGVWSSS
jgi:hypothetical protein